MPWSQVIELYEILDDGAVDGDAVAAWLQTSGLDDITVTRVDGEKGSTDFIKGVIPGVAGKRQGGPAPTLGVIGRLGGLGARPERLGFVSDGDGALVALTVAAKLARMSRRGDQTPGDVIVCTHVCPDAPTRPHEPVPFMDSPVDIAQMNEHEVDGAMDAVLSVDTTKGNRICNHNGFAISPTVMQGWILRVSDDLLNLYSQVTGRHPAVLPLTMQDITPYGNDVFHINSILQPATATSAPVVGVAITAEAAVAGCGTGATDLSSVEAAARFCIEAAKAFGSGSCRFVDSADFESLKSRYGSMRHLQGMGGTPNGPVAR
jgi:hypothetical protein